jgi:hypothetical protein
MIINCTHDLVFHPKLLNPIPGPASGLKWWGGGGGITTPKLGATGWKVWPKVIPDQHWYAEDLYKKLLVGIGYLALDQQLVDLESGWGMF